MSESTNQKSATPPDERRRRYAGKSLTQMSAAFVRKSRADNTQRSYKYSQIQFQNWCSDQGIDPEAITPEELGLYLCWLAVEKSYPPGTMRTKLSGIRRWFRDRQGRENVTQADHVRQVWDGIQREFADRPARAAALTLDIIREILEALPDRDGSWGIRALRDRALLLTGYGCAFRRSEISGLRSADVTFEDKGAVILLRRSKTDQVERGRWVGLGNGHGATCPVAALRTWLEAAPKGEYLFRAISRWGRVMDEPLTDHAIYLIVKSLVEMTGRDSEGFSAHSLRAGICTDLVSAGVSPSLIMQRTRHKSHAMLGVYNRPESELSTNFSALVNL